MIEINNLSGFRLNKKIFSTVAKKVLKGENRKTETLSLAFVKKQEMRKLNKKFRKKDKETDVLSFVLSARGGPAPSGKGFLGEVVICPEVVKPACQQAGKKQKDLVRIFIHGILHLCGYDHEKPKDAKIMDEKETFYLKN